jgi:hypothetical protein
MTSRCLLLVNVFKGKIYYNSIIDTVGICEPEKEIILKGVFLKRLTSFSCI